MATLPVVSCSFTEPVEYLEQLIETHNRIMGSDPDDYPHLANAFELVSASLSLLHPELPPEKHIHFFREVKWHQSWAGIDQTELSLLHTTQITGNKNILEQAAAGTPFIFCTFHMGSYRMLNPLLIARGIPFKLVTDQDFIEKQGDVARAIIHMASAHAGNNLEEQFEILNAEDPRVLMQAARCLRTGTSLVFYIDGNSGAGGMTLDKKSMARIRFMNQPFYARKGIAYLAHLTGIPVIPVISVRTGWLTRELHVLDPIVPQAKTDREEWSQQTTQQLYSVFEHFLRQHPGQWEGWFYAYKFLDPAQAPPVATDNRDFDHKKNYIFNFNMYGLLNFGGNFYLFNKRELKVSPVSNEFHQVLVHFSKPQQAVALDLPGLHITETAIKELYEYRILIHAS